MTMKTVKQFRRAGFTLLEIMIVVTIIGLLASIAIPNFVKARAVSQQTACINNLRQITAAVDDWALESGHAAGANVVMNDLTPYIELNSNSSIPLCPSGGSYTLGMVGSLPQVSCSLSTLAVEPHNLP
jgi:prepilin-type N-terminal cleavage/methylation domain-containing protein